MSVRTHIKNKCKKYAVTTNDFVKKNKNIRVKMRNLIINLMRKMMMEMMAMNKNSKINNVSLEKRIA